MFFALQIFLVVALIILGLYELSQFTKMGESFTSLFKHFTK